MKALTICQPYADAIIYGPKQCENRGWYMSYRGPLLIHAGKSREWLDEDDNGKKLETRDGRKLVFGAVIGKVEVVDCLQAEAYIKKYGNDAWTCFGPWCIRMINPVAFKNPIPWKGQLGLFEIPDAGW